MSFARPLGGLFRHVVDLASEQAPAVTRRHVLRQRGLCPRVDEALATVPGGLRLGVDTARIRRHPGLTDSPP